MDIKETITDKNGNQKQVKIQMPSIDKILNAINQRGMFAGFTRFQYLHYDVAEALKIVEAIGKSRNRKFVIDDENRFAYENFIKWCHCDPTMQALSPETKTVVPGRLNRGIYIAGNTGSGKSWCLEIMLAYCTAFGFKVQFANDDSPRPLWWRIARVDSICDSFMESGSIQTFKIMPMLGIQDFGSEPQETLYMGNRVDVVGNLIEYRGDITDEMTLITSNMSINGDNLKKRYGDRVSSRLIEMCNYLEIKGKDRRKM